MNICQPHCPPWPSCRLPHTPQSLPPFTFPPPSGMTVLWPLQGKTEIKAWKPFSLTALTPPHPHSHYCFYWNTEGLTSDSVPCYLLPLWCSTGSRPRPHIHVTSLGSTPLLLLNPWLEDPSPAYPGPSFAQVLPVFVAV